MSLNINGNIPLQIIAYTMNSILKENNTDFFIYETDSSLQGGFEAITRPFTLKWLYNNIEILQKVYDYLLSNKCTAEKTLTCGLHIHFSRTALKKDYSLAKIVYLINKLQIDFLRYSNRQLNKHDHYTTGIDYCSFDSIKSYEDINLDYFKRQYPSNNYQNYDHSNVVNVEHKKTIEIRIFKGTLDLKRIIANIELVSNLIYYVENHSENDIENVTFKELCLFKKTKYLKEYYYKTFEPTKKLKGVA